MIVGGLVLMGALGAVLRHRLGGTPWHTFAINVAGSFVLGLIAGASRDHGLGNTPTVVLGTGLCGAFTTFSTFSLDARRAGPHYVAASVGVGLLAAAGGIALASL